AILDGVVALNLVECTARKVDFSRIAVDRMQIHSSDLSGSRFANLCKLYLDFEKCQFEGAQFSGLKALGTPQFSQCNLKNANFTGAILEQANFEKSDLSGANFANANLKLAKFTGAKVDGADFTGATMIGAEIDGVDFSKAKGFDPAQVETKGGAGPA